MEYLAIGIYIVGMAVMSFVCGKQKIGDTVPFMVLCWPLVLLAAPFMWIYDQGKKS
jgi:hypothetical protein